MLSLFGWVFKLSVVVGLVVVAVVVVDGAVGTLSDNLLLSSYISF